MVAKSDREPPNVTVGLIGYGRFGKLAAKFIATKTNLLVYDKRRTVLPTSRRLDSLSRQVTPSRSAAIKHASLREVASQPVVILAVPVSALQETLHAVKPFLSDSKTFPSLVIDVCAVKAKPVQWMKRILPKNVEILATHPLFGPDSAKNSLKKHRIYMSPVRISDGRLRQVTDILDAAELVVERISPDAHDKIIAETLFLTQFVGRLLGGAGLRRRGNSTTSYADLMKIVKIADNDTRELFEDMVKYNPYAKGVLRKLLKAQQRILKNTHAAD